VQEENRKLVVETPTTSKRRTQSSVKRTASLKESHIQSTFQIVLDGSQPPSLVAHNLIVLADVVAHIVISEGDIDEQDITSLLILLGKMKKRKMTLTPSVSASEGLTKDPMDVEVQGTKTLHDIEMQEVNDQGDNNLDDVGTGLESNVEKSLA